MQRKMLRGKIHRATITEANLHYQGSVTIDADLMEAADLIEYEQVEVWNITNGNRFSTYTILFPFPPGSLRLYMLVYLEIIYRMQLGRLESLSIQICHMNIFSLP